MPFRLSSTVLALLIGYASAAERGEIAPEFTLPTMAADGLVRLSEYRGKVIYLDFWDSWCAPCRESMPWLTELRERYAREDFEVVAVNLDADPEDGRRFLAAVPVSYPVAMDPAAGSKARYGLSVLPTAFLIDRSGRVRHVHVGFEARDREEISRLVAQLVTDR